MLQQEDQELEVLNSASAAVTLILAAEGFEEILLPSDMSALYLVEASSAMVN